MNTSFLKYVFFLLAVIWLISGCSQPYPGFRQSDNGIWYRVHEHQDTGTKIQSGDIVSVRMKFYNPDTVLFSYLDNPQMPRTLDIQPSAYTGDIFDALRLLSAGDSATFILRGDSLFLQLFGFPEVPPYIKKDPMVWLDVRVEGVIPYPEADSIRAREEASWQENLEQMKQAEPGVIHDYLVREKITAKPTSSGLYYIELRAGKGPRAEKGKSITVNYTAMLPSGQIIETSLKEVAMKCGIFDTLFDYKPMEFIEGDLSTIPGWEEGISYMRQGGKARLVVPSSLAYGDKGLEDMIPPYSPVIYDIEILEVK
jgi:FKBP-type peptidyl-prolyl cis-trans isomerase FkpA